MRYTPWDEPHIRQHHDDVVRLHGGPHHGRIITLPEGSLRRGQLETPAPLSLHWLTDPDPVAPAAQVIRYHREKLAIYDEIDHAVDYYDYWIADGASLPRVG